jgi:hypothetical protein
VRLADEGDHSAEPIKLSAGAKRRGISNPEAPPREDRHRVAYAGGVSGPRRRVLTA